MDERIYDQNIVGYGEEDRAELEMRRKKRKKQIFFKGFLVGMTMSLVLLAVVVGGFALGTSLVSKKTPTQSIHHNKGTNAETVETQEMVGGSVYVDDGILTDEFMDEVNTIYQQMQYYYLYDIDEAALREGMLEGMLDALGDPYSVYYDESAFDSFTTQTEGEYYGIGCVVTQDLITGMITIVLPYEGTPAYEVGLMPGDILYAVNGEPVTGEDLDQVVMSIRGGEGTTVALTIVREGEDDYLHFDVERRQVEILSVAHHMKEDQIGYIAVSSFDGVTANQFIAAYEDLKSQGMKGLVIDMRDNGGGLLTTVEAMLDYLLPKGVIFYAKDKYGNKYLEYTSDRAAALDVPLAILINGNTASAAEVFSGNIQAFGKATLVGTNTYGKGIMQNTFTTNEEGTTAIKLTVADYYIHGDRNIHKVGIAPDVDVELDPEVAKQIVIADEDDNQLQEALRVVREQIQ